MFERPQSGERAVLVHASPDGLPEESEREEFAELARSAGAVITAELDSSRRKPEPRYFIGKGKLDELRTLIADNDAELVISSTAHETRVAILENDRLAEIYVERSSERALAGSIYKGRVNRVLPGMQSAFAN